MEAHTFITCLIAVTLLTLTPGLDTILVIRNSGRGGWRDGAASSLGICSGLFVHATVSALGISLILLKTAWAFNGLKFAGAAYLIWLGVTSWKHAVHSTRCIFPDALTGSESEFRFMRSLREGFLSNVLNPKTIIFYMAFLPQFIDPAGSPLMQSLLVAGLHFSVAMIYQCLLASMVDRSRNWLQKPGINRIFHGLTGSVMIMIGLKLVIGELDHR
ncbi:MAG: LysE family translocator [Deltaproteobacteria bacterium]|nr:LysE family translocator [Deltaproteobacteria bacterium]